MPFDPVDKVGSPGKGRACFAVVYLLCVRELSLVLQGCFKGEILFFSIILSNAEHQDLCLTYQLHMDYVTCLCSDLFLFSI